MFGKLGLGLGLGGGVSNPIPDTAPEMSFGASSSNQFFLAWEGQPTSGNIDTLISGGYLTFTGTVTASYNSGNKRWDIVITSGAKITIKQFRKLTKLFVYVNAGATWNYNGAMPKQLNYLCLYGDNISWQYTGSLPVGLQNRLYLHGTKINWNGWGVQQAFNFTPKVLDSIFYNINIGNFPVATEAETAHFLSKIDEKALDCSATPQTLTFKKTTQITSEQYLPILNSLTSKSYTIVLGS